ncbi:hypothetical protein AHAS_Ahas08G0168500 [Arachis hypogaea]
MREWCRLMTQCLGSYNKIRCLKCSSFLRNSYQTPPTENTSGSGDISGAGNNQYSPVLTAFYIGELPYDGVISGAVKHMFVILEAQGAEYNMKVILSELYNEKITDRVRREKTVKCEDDKSKSPIALMEDWKGGIHC